MKKLIAQSLVLLLILAVAVVAPPLTPAVDAVSAATSDGGTPAPAPAPTPTAPKPTPAPAATTVDVSAGNGTYVVVKGDSMWKIAVKHKMTLNQLIALNPQIKNPSMISVGQKIVVNAGTAAATPAPATATGKVKVYEGIGYTTAFRNGPGKDDTGTPVYSFNIAMARATFDEQGRILDVFIDGYEVATPNYDGDSMPHFSGWPGKEGYNVFDHTTATISGISTQTPESAAAEVGKWLTKRQRGDSYHMNPANEWYKQMDFFQNYFKGKTVAELEAWFAKNTTTAGRPIKANTTNEADLAKYNKLTDAEKAALADVVTGATMSIRDSHGDFLGAVGEAYKNRKLVEITVK